MEMLWPSGTATGIGSLPGEDPAEALAFVLDELTELPYLPELPARGPGASMIGRGAAHLAEMHVDLQPSGWRLVDRAGMDERRARDFLRRDLDALEEATQGYSGLFKVQVAGPWTLAASVELERGDKVLADPGAVRDLIDSLAEGLSHVVADLRRRMPAARLMVQLDEPSLPAVLLGRVPTASGFGALAPVEEHAAREALRAVAGAITAAGAAPLAHCCAASVPIRTLVGAGMRAVSLDAALLTEDDDEALGEAVESGVGLLLGLVPALGPGVPPTVRATVDPLRRLWGRLGFAPERLGEVVVVTPACGLAGASPGWVATAHRLCRQAARTLVDAPEQARS